VWAPNVVVPLSEVEEILNRFRPLVRLAVTHPGETALRYTFDDGVGEIRVIARSGRRFAARAAASVSLRRERSGPACFRSQSMISTLFWRVAARIRIWRFVFCEQSKPGKRGITLANRDL
jgi:hypothetical protein